MANAKSEFFELQQHTKACRMVGMVLLGASVLFLPAWYLWIRMAMTELWSALSLFIILTLLLQTASMFFTRMKTIADAEGLVIKIRYGLQWFEQCVSLPWGDIVSAEIAPCHVEGGLRRWNPFSFDLLRGQMSLGRYRSVSLSFRTALTGSGDSRYNMWSRSKYFGPARGLGWMSVRYNMWFRTELLLTTIHGEEVFIGTQQPEALLEFCRGYIKNK